MPPYDDFITQAIASIGGGVDPELLRAMMETESSFNPNAVSDKGATGLMQIMPETGAEMGFSAEDLQDPYKNTLAGATYMKKLLGMHGGDPVLALASYNAGMGNVAKHGGVPPFPETQGYIDKVAERSPSLANHPSYTALRGISPVVPAAEQEVTRAERAFPEDPPVEQPEYGEHKAADGLILGDEKEEFLNDIFITSIKKLFPANVAWLGEQALRAANALPMGDALIPDALLGKPFQEPGLLGKKSKKWRDEGENELSRIYLDADTNGSWRETIAMAMAKGLGENPDLILDAWAGVSTAKMGEAILSKLKLGGKPRAVLGKPMFGTSPTDLANATESAVAQISTSVLDKARESERIIGGINDAMAKSDDMETALRQASSAHIDEIHKIYTADEPLPLDKSQIFDLDSQREILEIVSKSREQLLVEKLEELKQVSLVYDDPAIQAKEARRLGTELAALARASQRGQEALPMNKGNALYHKLLASSQQPTDDVMAGQWVDEAITHFVGPEKVKDPYRLGPIRAFDKHVRTMYDWSKNYALRGMRKMGQMTGDLSEADKFEAAARMELDAGGVALNDVNNYTFNLAPDMEPVPTGEALKSIVQRYKNLGMSEEDVSKAVNGRMIADRILNDGVERLNMHNRLGGMIETAKGHITTLKLEQKALGKLVDEGLGTPEIVKKHEDYADVIADLRKSIRNLTEESKVYQMEQFSANDTIQAARLRAGLDHLSDPNGIAIANRLNEDVRLWSVRSYLEKMYQMEVINDKQLAKVLADNKYYSSLEKLVDNSFLEQENAMRAAGMNPEKFLARWAGSAEARGQTPFERLVQKSVRFNRFYLQQAINKTFIDEYARSVEEFGADEIFKRIGIHMKRESTPPVDGTPYTFVWRDGKKEFWSGSNGIIEELMGTDTEISKMLHEVMFTAPKKLPWLSMGAVNRAQRIAATGTPSFVSRAPLRDIPSHWMFSITRPRMGVDTLIGMKEMIASGIKGTPADAAWDDALKATLDQLPTEFWSKGHGASFMQAMDMPMDAIDLSTLYAGKGSGALQSLSAKGTLERAVLPFEILGKSVDVSTRMGSLQRMLSRTKRGKGYSPTTAFEYALQKNRKPIPGLSGFKDRYKFFREEGGSKFVERLRDTQDPTLNFQQYGRLMRGVNAWKIFANPIAKETSMIFKAMADRPITFMTRGLFPMTTYAALLWATELRHDSDWRELDDSWKAMMVPLPRFGGLLESKSGRRFVLPSPHSLGFLFFRLPLILMENASERMGADNVAGQILEGLSPSIPLPGIAEAGQEFGRELQTQDVDPGEIAKSFFIGASPSSLQPFTEHSTNKEQFSGRKVLPMGMDPASGGPLPKEQATEYTTPTAEYIAKAMGTSPILVDHYMNGWLPGLARNITDATDNLLGKSIGRAPSVRDIESLAPHTGIRSNILGRTVETLGRRIFTLAPPYGQRGQTVKEFKERYYDLLPQYRSIKELEERIRDKNASKQSRLAALERIKEELGKNPQLSPSYINGYAKVIKEINEKSDEVRTTANSLKIAMDMVNDNEKMSNADKHKFYKKWEQKITDMMRWQTFRAATADKDQFANEDWMKNVYSENVQFLKEMEYLIANPNKNF